MTIRHRVGRVSWHILGSAGLLMAGCQSVDSRSDEGVASAVQALSTSCAIGADCTITALYPSGIAGKKMAIAAKSGVTIGSGSELRGADGQYGAAISESGLVQVGASSRLGDIWTLGNAWIGGQALVAGSPMVKGTLEKQAGASVPPKAAPQGTSAAKANINVKFAPVPANSDVRVMNNTTRTLEPGRYGALEVHGGSKVKLKPGVFYFESVQLESNALLEADTSAGTAVVFVRGDFTSRAKWTSTTRKGDIFVGCLATGRVDIGGEFDATLLAPAAQIVIASANGPAHDGVFFGKTVELQGATRVAGTELSRTGAAFEGITGTWTPASGVTAPTPPNPAGKTWDEYRAELVAYVNQLIASGYRGLQVEVPAHPDAKKVSPVEESLVPSAEAAAQGKPISVSSAPAVPTRSSDPVQHEADAKSETRAAVNAAVEETHAELPFTNVSDPAQDGIYGRGVGPAPAFPKTCTISQAAFPGETDVGELEAQFGGSNSYSKTLDYGRVPAYIDLSAWPEDANRIRSGSVPAFDAYYFLNGNLSSGFASDRGLYGKIELQAGLGGVVLNNVFRLLDARFVAEANSAYKRADSTEREPFRYSRGSAVNPFGKVLQWGAETGNTSGPLYTYKGMLLEGNQTLFPGGGLRFPVGPFTVLVNGGAEVEVPFALNILDDGPEVTVAPMVRAYIVVFGGIDAGIKVGLEGEADLLRVDVPFSGKLKWHNNLQPEVCAASIDLKATVRFDVSTLNGKLSIVAGISDSIIPGLLYKEELMTWDGWKLASAEINLIDKPIAKVLTYPKSMCNLGQLACANQAPADHEFTSFASSKSDSYLLTSAEYGSPNACPGQYVVNVPLTGYGEDGAWMLAAWRAEDVPGQAECEAAWARLDAWRSIPGDSGQVTWESAGSVIVKGSWSDACYPTYFSGQDLNGELPLPGLPWSWVKTVSSSNPAVHATSLRMAVATEVGCSQKPLKIALSNFRY